MRGKEGPQGVSLRGELVEHGARWSPRTSCQPRPPRFLPVPVTSTSRVERAALLAGSLPAFGGPLHRPGEGVGPPAAEFWTRSGPWPGCLGPGRSLRLGPVVCWGGCPAGWVAQHGIAGGTAWPTQHSPPVWGLFLLRLQGCERLAETPLPAH